MNSCDDDGRLIRRDVSRRCFLVRASLLGATGLMTAPDPAGAAPEPAGSRVTRDREPAPAHADNRPVARYRLEAADAGRVLRHGDGPGQCDILGAREAIVFEHGGRYYLHYDGAGPGGWRACLATSPDLVNWEKKGAVLDLGAPGAPDSAGACSPWVFRDGGTWHMFYLGTPNATPAPNHIPSFPYLTLKARSRSPSGPWEKQYDVRPFGVRENSYYSSTASPGHVIRRGDEYLMFFSAATLPPRVLRTLSLARTRDLDGIWTVNEKPILPPEEQVENSSLYFEKTDGTWWLFTNHIGTDGKSEWTDAVWVYWSRDPERWDPANKAVVLDGRNVAWSRRCIGMPTVVPVGGRLAILYDAPGGDSIGHMNRDIGLAWLPLPLRAPVE